MVMAECAKCKGTGFHAYDDNHISPCDRCCPHDQGYWLLSEHYGDHNELWCCRAGCGHLKENDND